MFVDGVAQYPQKEEKCGRFVVDDWWPKTAITLQKHPYLSL